MTRTLIIGDIHGCYDELLALCAQAQLRDDDQVVSVGDLVDRGPAPGAVLRWFRERPGAVALMGNHERKHVRGVFSFSQEITRLQLGEAYPSEVEWMRGLPYFWHDAHVAVVHAALEPGVALAAQRPEVLAGTTSGEAYLRQRLPDGAWHEHYRGPLPVAFGHHVVGPAPLVRDGLIYGLDTGACHGHYLTALSVPDFRLYQVRARADHWDEVKRHWQVATLAARPWLTLPWRKLDEELAERGRGAADVRRLAEALGRWAAQVRALVPVLLARVPALVAELEREHGARWTDEAQAHPARALLYLAARGRLDRAAIESRCATPALTLELARKLGAPAPSLERPPTAA